MPTLLIWHGHKFRFYALDRGEPPHVHVVKDGKSLKVWLEPVAVARRIGYNDREIERLLTVIAQHRNEWIEAWNDFFGV
ncbi:DUF4160 domain-containing protein [Rhizobium sp. TRM95111]|jgi:hypothetical protein|uniref:DUF4160 domain-containing protein n=1 Tax=Rhizobium alarense TaxID=2846851 RepID=UPI001F2B7EBB|nr:DUF4160 domain-containing protein [Rhizobium alarense]MCF3640775.1 DUF4160 domain-containing protein [Rhizobium alarense]